MLAVAWQNFKTQFVLNKTYCWVVLNDYILGVISPVCSHSFSGI